MSESTGARETAKRATRTAILEAALSEFFVHGFDGPSLDAICARAGYTRGAFYVHFRSRDELIAAAMEHAFRVFLDEVIADAGGEGEIEASVRRFVRIGLTPDRETGRIFGPPMRQILEACHRSPGVRASFLAVLGEAFQRVAAGVTTGQAASRLRKDVSADDMAGLLVVLALGSRTAEELGLELDVASTRDAVLRLLRASG